MGEGDQGGQYQARIGRVRVPLARRRGREAADPCRVRTSTAFRSTTRSSASADRRWRSRRAVGTRWRTSSRSLSAWPPPAIACCCTTGATAAPPMSRSIHANRNTRCGPTTSTRSRASSTCCRRSSAAHRRARGSRCCSRCATRRRYARCCCGGARGGAFAVRRLAEKYYNQYIRLAQEGGMAAVCAEEHFATLIPNRPSNRKRLMAIEPGAFIAIMRAWREPFVAGAELPLIGTSADDLRRIEAPACIIPRDDLTHPSPTGLAAPGLMRDCEVHRVTDADQNVDVTPVEDWYARAGDMGAIFADFLKRKLDVKAPAASLYLSRNPRFVC